MRKRLLMLVATGAVLGLATVSAAQPDPNKRLSDAERNACVAKGGRTATFGFSGVEGCVLPMADAGKQCTDGSQCDGHMCLLDDKKPGFKPPKPGQKNLVGQCAPTNYFYGCAWRVSNGQLANGMCVD
jgi:hypothetical protein